jgi:ComEC/Rec2-related protein
VDARSFASIVGLLTLLASAWALPYRFIGFSLLIGSLCAMVHWRSLEDLAHQRSLVHETVWTNFQAHIEKVNTSPHGSWKGEARIVSAQHLPDVKKIILYGRGNAPELGETIATSGRWEPIPGPRNEGEFDRRAHLTRHGIVAECRVISWTSVKPPHLADVFTARARHAFEHTIIHGLPPQSDEAKVILAMVMGKQPIDGDSLVEPFRQTGTLHLFSVSGQHVNLVAVILWFALRWLRVPRRYAVFFLIPAIFSYAVVTGASAPAMRAAWMASLFLAAFVFQRKSDLMQALSLVVIAALLMDPNMLFLPGVQLSYGIVAVISIGLSLSSQLLDRFPGHDPYLPRELLTPWQARWEKVWCSLLQSTFISFSAFVGSSFLTVVYFSMITPISVLANLVLSPLVAALLALSMLATAISPFSSRGTEWCNGLNQWVARACLITTQKFAAIPGSHLVVSVHRSRQDALRIFDLPRGGGATSIQGRNADALLDCGNARAFSSIVLPSLRHFAHQPRHLILSNPKAGHMGGAGHVVEQFDLARVIPPLPEARTPSFRALTQAAIRHGTPCDVATPGQRISLARDIDFVRLLAPDPDDRYARADDRTAVDSIHFHGYHFLFLQDASALVVQDLIHSQKIPPCDVLVLGRHRLHPATLTDVIVAFRPRAVIASHADFPEVESIPADWSAIAKRRRVAFFHQGQTGMVTATIGPNSSLSLKSFLTSQTCHLPSPKNASP